MRQETYTVPWGIRNGMFVAFLLFLGIFIASFFVHYTRRIGLGTTVIEIDYPVDNSGSIESISPDKFRAILHCKWRWPVNRNFFIRAKGFVYRDPKPDYHQFVLRFRNPRS